jgi:ribose transport system substrate-binding protein
VLCQIASDNHAAGRLACEALASANSNAQIVIVHLSLNRACIDRVAGFRSELGKHPGMKILDIQDGKGTTQGARPVMEELIDRFPQINAVFAINDPSALGCIEAIEAAGRGGTVTVVSVDGSQEGIEAIENGKLHATVAQSPGKIGRRAAVVALEHLEGRPVERDIKIPVTLVTNQNPGGLLIGR